MSWNVKCQMSWNAHADPKKKHPELHTSERTIVPRTVIFDWNLQRVIVHHHFVSSLPKHFSCHKRKISLLSVLWSRISIFKTCTKKLFSVTYPSLTTDQNWIETLFANKSSSHELYLHKDWTWECEHRIRVFQHLTVLYIYALRLYKNTAVSQSQLRLCVFSPDCKYCSL